MFISTIHVPDTTMPLNHSRSILASVQAQCSITTLAFGLELFFEVSLTMSLGADNNSTFIITTVNVAKTLAPRAVSILKLWRVFAGT